MTIIRKEVSMSNFAQNLAIAMNRKGYTPQDMASSIDAPLDHVQGYLAGNFEPDPPTIRKMAEVLNLNVGDLGGDEILTFDGFGAELRRMRHKAGLSGNELAHLLNMAPSVLLKIEKGTTKTASKETLDKLRDLFGDEFKSLERKYRKELVAENRRQQVVLIKPQNDDDRAAGAEVAGQINKALKATHLTVEQLATKADISLSTLNRIRLQGYRPTPELAERLSNVLGTEITVPVVTAPKAEVASVTKPTAPIVALKPVSAESTDTNLRNILNKGVDLLSYIESDAEYRAAASALMVYALDGTEPDLSGYPQASLVFKMVVS